MPREQELLGQTVVVTYWHQVEKGCHFAAWEQPELSATEIRAASASLR